uniref:Uncharacterized protein n=1 Tax=Oryza brachyantha TaxID=4533 RepID=J3LLZ9_ORYBR
MSVLLRVRPTPTYLPIETASFSEDDTLPGFDLDNETRAAGFLSGLKRVHTLKYFLFSVSGLKMTAPVGKNSSACQPRVKNFKNGEIALGSQVAATLATAGSPLPPPTQSLCRLGVKNFKNGEIALGSQVAATLATAGSPLPPPTQSLCRLGFGCDAA